MELLIDLLPDHMNHMMLFHCNTGFEPFIFESNGLSLE